MQQLHPIPKLLLAQVLNLGLFTCRKPTGATKEFMKARLGTKKDWHQQVLLVQR
jgi:hypothetical protein